MNTLVRSGRTLKSPGRQRGLVVVELAIITPVVLMIMLATAEIGRAFFQYTTLTKAVEAGTRYYASAINDTEDMSDKEKTARNLVVYGSPQAGGVKVLPDPWGTTDVIVQVVGTSPDEHVRVTTSYDFQPIIGQIPIFGTIITFPMTASNTMRVL